MAAKGESKQGLIITLVFFVLATIILGVTTYMGYDGQKKFDDDRKAAEAKAKDLEGNRTWNRFQNLQWKAYLGVPLTKNEQEDLASLRGQFDGGAEGFAKGDASAAEVIKAIRDRDANAEYKWDSPSKKPAKTATQKISELETALAAKTADVNETKTATDAAVVRLQNEKKSLQQALDQAIKNLDDAKKAAASDLSKYVAQLQEEKKTFDKLSAEKEERTKDYEKQLTGKLTEIAALMKQMDQLRKNVEKQGLELENIRRVDLIDKDQPKGKVVSISNGGTPLINLGSADNVKAQLTFNIHGVGPDGRPLKERKATVEIMNVLSEHRSNVRITSVRDQNREPIVPGDFLFNAAWSPTLKQHVAIAGVVDLSGTSVNSPEVQMRNLREFMRNLEAQNIKVDAYLDLKTMKMEGEITRQTEYLIVGDTPSGPGGLGGEAQNERASNIGKRMTEMQKVAADNAVSVITLRKYLAATGYKMPRGSGEAELRSDRSR